MSDLESLRQKLQKAFAVRPRAGAIAGNPEALARLAAVRQALSPPRGHRSLPRIARGVMSLRLRGRGTPYPELKYACYGVAQPVDWEGRVLLDEARLLDDLLFAVGALRDDPPRFGQCYRGLLTAWLSDVAGGEPMRHPAAAGRGEQKLKDFLLAGRAILAGARRPAAWTALLSASGLDDTDGLRRALGIEA